MLTVAEDPALYSRVHRLVRELRGPASAQLCARCVEDGLEKQAHDWAQVHTEDGLDPWTDYVSLCRSCHEIYDDKNTGRTKSPETRAKISAANKGRILSPEQKEALINSVRGKPKTQEHRDKIAASHKGKHHSEETRAKMSEIARGKQANRERDSQGRYS
jgi:hypothetical protein